MYVYGVKVSITREYFKDIIYVMKKLGKAAAARSETMLLTTNKIIDLHKVYNFLS